MKKYNYVVCGGTFDYFHRGHKAFLKFTSSISKKADVGITTDIYTKKYKPESILPFTSREKEVKGFIKKHRLNNLTLIPIDIPYGKTLLEPEYEAIVVTEDTKKTAEVINRKRTESSLKPLNIIIVPFEKDEEENTISSRRIRNGEIDREGRVYILNDWCTKTFVLPQNKRIFLKKPWGLVFKNPKKFLLSHVSTTQWITVGDVSTVLFNELKIVHKIAVVDFLVERVQRFVSLKDLGFSGKEKVIHVVNKKGTLSGEILSDAQRAIHSLEQRVVILVKGEEDLTVIAFLLAAPLGWTIFYGQPHQGLVVVTITEAIKNKAYNTIQSFKKL